MGKCRQAAIANFDSYVSSIYPKYVFRGLLRCKVRNRNVALARYSRRVPVAFVYTDTGGYMRVYVFAHPYLQLSD